MWSRKSSPRLQKLQRDGLTILLVEQKLDIALTCTTRAYVMLKGAARARKLNPRAVAAPDLHDLYFKLSAPSPQLVEAPI